jgi:fructose-1,6-bisphosphatase I
LYQGDVFLYPGTTKQPEWKLQWLDESAPLAFSIEQAGGRASTGTQDILAVVPDKIHARTPLIIGSKEDVGLVESYVREQLTVNSYLCGGDDGIDSLRRCEEGGLGYIFSL